MESGEQRKKKKREDRRKYNMEEWGRYFTELMGGVE